MSKEMEEIIDAAYLSGFEPSSEMLDSEDVYHEAIEHLANLAII